MTFICRIPPSQAILKLSQSARGHFMTLIEVSIHVITYNPGPDCSKAD